MGSFGLMHVIILLVLIVPWILSIVFGMKGNSWREKNLISRGFEFKDIISASNPEGALALYLKEMNKSL